MKTLIERVEALECAVGLSRETIKKPDQDCDKRPSKGGTVIFYDKDGLTERESRLAMESVNCFRDTVFWNLPPGASLQIEWNTMLGAGGNYSITGWIKQ